MSLFRQVIKQLFRHDQEHTQELLSIKSASVCISQYNRPHNYAKKKEKGVSLQSSDDLESDDKRKVMKNVVHLVHERRDLVSP